MISPSGNRPEERPEWYTVDNSDADLGVYAREAKYTSLIQLRQGIEDATIDQQLERHGSLLRYMGNAATDVARIERLEALERLERLDRRQGEGTSTGVTVGQLMAMYLKMVPVKYQSEGYQNMLRARWMHAEKTLGQFIQDLEESRGQPPHSEGPSDIGDIIRYAKIMRQDLEPRD